MSINDEFNNFVREAGDSDFEILNINNDDSSMLEDLNVNGDTILNTSQMKGK